MYLKNYSVEIKPNYYIIQYYIKLRDAQISTTATFNFSVLICMLKTKNISNMANFLGLILIRIKPNNVQGEVTVFLLRLPRKENLCVLP